MTTIDKWSLLAGLRFLLASIVAINHLAEYTPLGILAFIPEFGAFEAILGFLLISGYSISVSYAKQPQGFLMRRIFRLYPIYLAAMVITYIAFILLKQPKPGAIFLLCNALFCNQLFTTESFVGPAWSLSLEFWLYCLTPLLILLSDVRIRLIVLVSFASYLCYTILRTTAHMPFYSGVGYGANLAFLSFIWLAGLRLARSGPNDKTALRDVALIFSCHIFLGALIQFGSRFKHHAVASFFTHDAVGFAMQSATLIFVYLVFKHLVIVDRPNVHRSRFLRVLGDISYPLYLLHAAIFGMLQHFGMTKPILLYLGAVLISGGVYWLLDFYSKRRHLKMGTA